MHGNAQVERCVVAGMKPYFTHAPQATYNREPWARTKTALLVFGQGLILLALSVVMYFSVLIVAALMEPLPEPETRHFPAAIKSESYSRTQRYWGDD